MLRMRLHVRSLSKVEVVGKDSEGIYPPKKSDNVEREYTNVNNNENVQIFDMTATHSTTSSMGESYPQTTSLIVFSITVHREICISVNYDQFSSTMTFIFICIFFIIFYFIFYFLLYSKGIYHI